MTISEIKSVIESSKKLSFEEKFNACLLRFFYEDMAFELTVAPKDSCEYSMSRLLGLIRMCLGIYSCHIRRSTYDKDIIRELDKMYCIIVDYVASEFKHKNGAKIKGEVSNITDLIIHDLNKRNYTVTRTNDGFTVSGWNR